MLSNVCLRVCEYFVLYYLLCLILSDFKKIVYTLDHKYLNFAYKSQKAHALAASFWVERVWLNLSFCNANLTFCKTFSSRRCVASVFGPNVSHKHETDCQRFSLCVDARVTEHCPSRRPAKAYALTRGVLGDVSELRPCREIIMRCAREKRLTACVVT
jgi:hypothetical protein